MVSLGDTGDTGDRGPRGLIGKMQTTYYLYVTVKRQWTKLTDL